MGHIKGKRYTQAFKDKIFAMVDEGSFTTTAILKKYKLSSGVYHSWQQARKGLKPASKPTVEDGQKYYMTNDTIVKTGLKKRLAFLEKQCEIIRAAINAL